MKRLHSSIIFLSLSTFVFGQVETPLNLLEGQIQLQKFVIDNIDSIKNRCNCDGLHFMAKYDPEKQIAEQIGFYSSIDYKDENRLDVWPVLEQHARRLFYFVPSIAPNEYPSKIEIGIILDKKDLKKSINWDQKRLQIDDRSLRVKENSNFTIKIDSLYYNKYVNVPDSQLAILKQFSGFGILDIKDREISSKLTELNSNAIWLDKKTCLIIRLSKTSYKGLLVELVEINIYHDYKLIFQDEKNRNGYKVDFTSSTTTNSKKYFGIDLEIQLEE